MSNETDTPVTAIPGPAPAAPPPSSVFTWLTVAAIVVQAIMTAELFAPGSTAGKVLQCIAMVLTGIGGSLIRKAPTRLLPVAIVVSMLALTGCTEKAFKDATVVGAKRAVNCLAPSLAPQVNELRAAFADIVENALMPDGKIDEAPLRKVAETLKSDVPRCALTGAMAALLHGVQSAGEAPQSSPLEVDKAQASGVLESVQAGWGATYVVEGGK